MRDSRFQYPVWLTIWSMYIEVFLVAPNLHCRQESLVRRCRRERLSLCQRVDRRVASFLVGLGRRGITS